MKDRMKEICGKWIATVIHGHVILYVHGMDTHMMEKYNYGTEA